MRNSNSPDPGVARIRNGETILGSCLVAASLAFLLYTVPYPLGAAVWPRIVLLLLTVLGSVIAVRGYLRSTGDMDGDSEWSRAVLRGPALTLLIVVGYVALVSIIGFFPATALYLCAHLWFSGVRDLKVLAGVTVAFVGLVYLLFIYALEVPLPTGLVFG
jgi:putative tricarboxylic transport membrane protein